MTMRWAIMMSLLLAVLISAMGVVLNQYTSRKLFVEMQSLQQQHDDLLTQFGRLQLEQSTWATHGRIERIAREQLNMHIPKFNEVKIINSHDE